MQAKRVKNIIILSGTVWFLGCTSSNKTAPDDPIAIYSIIKEDTTTGIDIVSLSGSTPIEVRKNIAEYEIPETTFEAKRNVFYSILDTLYRLKTSAGQKQGIYNTIDSLNYM
jgi:hypothetical protein